MLLPVPYIAPGEVRQITPKAGSSEVILALPNNLEMTSLLTITAPAKLNLKRKDPAYLAIFRFRNAAPHGIGVEKFLAKHTDTLLVTINRGPDSAARIAQAKEQVMATGHPSPEQEEAWARGFAYVEDYRAKIRDVAVNMNRCEPPNERYEIESVQGDEPGGIWRTFPHGHDCEARIQNEKDKYTSPSAIPSADAVAWSHGFATHDAFKAAMGGGFGEDGPTLAGFIYTGSKNTSGFFESSNPTGSPGKDAWAVPVNLYEGGTRIGHARAVAFTMKRRGLP